MGGVSAAGFRPGLGRGGTIHSLLVKMAGGCNDTDNGRAGLLTMDEVAGARACGETVDSGDEVSDADISRSDEAVLEDCWGG